MSGVWAVVVAAGSGARFGGAKQYEPLGDRRVVDHAVADARAGCDGVVVVVHAEEVERQRALLPLVDAVVAGGATRSASVAAGLAAVPASADVICVHDAARPLAGAELFAAVVAAVRAGADGAIPTVPVADTIRHVDGGTVDRSTLLAVQTPQAFAAAPLRAAYERGGEATDDATLVEAAGGKVVTVPGHPSNLKITRVEDLAVASALLGR